MAPRQFSDFFTSCVSQILIGNQFADLLVVGLQCGALCKLSLLFRTLGFKFSLLLPTLFLKPMEASVDALVQKVQASQQLQVLGR